MRAARALFAVVVPLAVSTAIACSSDYGGMEPATLTDGGTTTTPDADASVPVDAAPAPDASEDRILATEQQWGAIALGDDEVVYMGTQSDLKRVSKSGGPSVVIQSAATGEYARSFATDGQTIAFVTGSGAFTCPASGCSAAGRSTLALESASSIAVHGGNAFWIGPTSKNIRVCPLTGCMTGPTTLATWAGTGTLAWLGVDASGLYASTQLGVLLHAPLAGGALAQLTTGAGTNGILTATDIVFSSAGSFRRCAKTGCASPTTITAAPQTGGFAAENATLYWGGFFDPDVGAIGPGMFACPLTGCAAGTPMDVGGVPAVGPIALDTQRYYFWNVIKLGVAELRWAPR